MGVTLTDVLLFGKAQSDDVDNATLVIYRRNILRWSALGGYLDIIVKGVSPLNLPDAVANSLSHVKAFGGTEQRNIPQPYTQVNYVTNTAQTAVDTGIMIDFAKNYEFEVECRAVSGSWYILQSRASASGNVTGIHGETSGSNIKLVVGNVTVCTSAITRTVGNKLYVKATLNNGTATLYVKDETANTEDTKTGSYGTSQPNPTAAVYLLGNAGGQYADINSDIYMARIKENDTVVMDYVPARQVATAGFYDKASGTFKTALTPANLSADGNTVPTPDAPIDIVCNNGFLRFRKQSGLPVGYSLLVGLQINTALDIGYTPKNTTKIYTKWARTRDGVAQYVYRSDSSSSGTTNCTAYFGTSGSGNWRFGADSNLISAPASGTVVESVQDSTGVDINGDFYAYTTAGTFTSTQTLKVGESNGAVEFYRITIYENNVMVRDLLPVQKTSDSTYGLFDIVNNVYYQTTARVTPVVANDPVEIYADGTVETIKDSLNNTATTEMLLKVGDYQDEQEILSGAVTRKVGVKVFDGTEDWTASGATGRYYTAISDMFTFSGRSEGLCSHYNYSGASGAGLNTYFFTTARRLFVYTEYETATDFKAFIASQYAAGTPVIVLYPLATPTTESVAGQTLQVQAGDNVLEITQASLSGLELEAQYQAAVSLTIEEVEDANLDNNVEVTIS